MKELSDGMQQINTFNKCTLCSLIFTNLEHFTSHVCCKRSSDYVEEFILKSLQVQEFSSDDATSKICRLCARLSPHYLYILETIEISSKLSEILPILIRVDDTLPMSICVFCINKVHLFHDFYTRIQGTQEYLETVRPPCKSVDIPYGVSVCDEEIFPNEKQDMSAHVLEQYSCHLCGQSFQSEKQLTGHMNGIHELPVVGDCDDSVSNHSKPGSDHEWTEIEMIDVRDESDENDGSMDDATDDSGSNSNTSSNLKTRRCMYNKPKRKKLEDVLKITSHRRGHINRNICDVCGKVLQTQNLLAKHKNTHVQREMACGVCSMIFNTFHEWFEHRKHQHLRDKKTFQCTACKKKFDSSTRLSGHVKGCIVVSVLRFKCECDKMFKDHATYIEHKNACKIVMDGLVVNASNYDVEIRRYECSCKHISPTFKQYLDHYREMHLECGELHCKECNKNFSNVSTLLSHNMDRHSEDVFKCTKCEKVLKSLRALKAHINTHEKRYQHTCNKCGVSCTRYHNLVRHQSKSKYCSIKENPPKCYRCIRLFPTSDDLVEHVKGCVATPPTVASTRSYKKTERCRDWICFMCGKILTTKFSLRTHELQHTGEKPFVCDTCGANFRSTANLLQHTKSMHMDKRQFACKLCDKRFKRPAHLRSHAAVHIDYKQHECDICFKRFKYIGDMKIHRKRHIDFGPIM